MLSVLGDGKPRSQRELVQETELGAKSVEGVLYRLWRKGVILRMEKPIHEVERAFRGRTDVRKNTRGYHLYMPGRRAGSDNIVKTFSSQHEFRPAKPMNIIEIKKYRNVLF